MLNPSFSTNRSDEQVAACVKCRSAALPQTQATSTGAGIEVRRLVRGEEQQALYLLNYWPVKNVMMIGLIRDHGLESPLNRGTFYGCFAHGDLIGVALIGHYVLFCGGDETVAEFANVARLYHQPEIRIVLGEESTVDEFCRRLLQPPCHLTIHQATPQLLLALRHPTKKSIRVKGLRRARTSEAHEIARINAGAYLELNGIDPAKLDPTGFQERVLSRIKMGRIWILRDDRGITFKADVASATDEAVYIEGVWTRPDQRGSGIGTAAFSRLCDRLLNHHKAICLLADAANQRTLSFYHRCGFKPIASYRLIRCRPQAS